MITSSARQPLPDLLSASFSELSKGLAQGDFNSVELTIAYIERIQEVNPRLRAVLELNPYAVLDAKRLDIERATGKTRGPLHGLPILVKGSIATARSDQTCMNTTAGSYALLGSVPPGDATIVVKLKQAGCIILGKNNLSEWSNYRSLDQTDGWSGLGGQTLGAFYENQLCGGSSSGSAVAASVGLSMASLGGETRGSILGPANLNNVAAIKPTSGLTSRHLVIPISATSDTVGPMAPDIMTCAAVLQACAGRDQQDPLSLSNPLERIPDYVKGCKLDSLKGTRIGIPTTHVNAYNDFPDYEKAAFDAALVVMQNLGAIIQHDVEFPTGTDYESVVEDAVKLRHRVQFVEGVGQYLEGLEYNPNGITSAQDLLDYTKACPAELYAERNAIRIEQAIELGLNSSSPEFIAAAEACAFYGAKGTILGALENYDLDVLVLPSTRFELPPLAGYPQISVPLGHYPADANGVTGTGGLISKGPNAAFGISFVGRKWSEEKLIGYAYAFEQATQVRGRVQPLVKPSAQLHRSSRSVASG